MQTIKTIVVVGLLLAVCYGAFVALNAPEVSIPEELEQWASATNEKTLQDFEIPALSIPEPFSSPGASAHFSPSQVDQATSLPQFPAIDPPLPTLGQPNQTSIAGSSTSSAVAFPNASISPPSSGATLTSNPSLTNSSLGTNSASTMSTGGMKESQPFSSPSVDNVAGPSIPFNADQPPSNSAIDDLISAGGALSSSSAAASSWENQTVFPPIDPTAVSQGNGPRELGLLASRTIPTDQPESASTSTEAAETLLPFSVSRTQALEMAQAGKLAEALELMSEYYESPELDYAEHTDLVDLLDALAREVIYSDRSLLIPKHTVSAQDTLEGLAAKQRINAELLAAVNKMGESQALLASTEIKLIEGPFRAQISLSRGELTLFLRKMYAGRFPVSISQQNKPSPGTYEVVDRRKDRTFYGANAVISAGAPTNPYGGYWLSLGGNLSIHSSPEQVTNDLEEAGCISLAPLDAADVYRILSKGSSVEVRP